MFPFYDSSESPFNAVNLGTQTSVPGVSESEPSYTYVLNCPCGQMLKEPTEDAIVEVDTFDQANIAVINLLVVVILNLHDLVAGCKGPAEPLDLLQRTSSTMRDTACSGSSAGTK